MIRRGVGNGAVGGFGDGTFPVPFLRFPLFAPVTCTERLCWLSGGVNSPSLSSTSFWRFRGVVRAGVAESCDLDSGWVRVGCDMMNKVWVASIEPVDLVVSGDQDV